MNKNVVLYVIAGLLIVVILLLTFFPNMIHVWEDSGKEGTDKCSPPPGQTEEEWREHMSHHPDVYRECL